MTKSSGSNVATLKMASGCIKDFRHNPKEILQPHDTAWGVASCTVYTHIHTWLHSYIYINWRAKFITSDINIYNVTNRASSELNLLDADHHHFCAPNQINRPVCSDNTAQHNLHLRYRFFHICWEPTFLCTARVKIHPHFVQVYNIHIELCDMNKDFNHKDIISAN